MVPPRLCSQMFQLIINLQVGTDMQVTPCFGCVFHSSCCSPHAACLHSRPQAAMNRVIHDSPWTTIKFAQVARKQQLTQ
jgi:hypothetical protein